VRRRLEREQRLRDFVLAGWRRYCSPEQIAQELKQTYPDDPSMRISHEAIYTYLYVLPRGSLR